MNKCKYTDNISTLWVTWFWEKYVVRKFCERKFKYSLVQFHKEFFEKHSREYDGAKYLNLEEKVKDEIVEKMKC